MQTGLEAAHRSSREIAQRAEAAQGEAMAALEGARQEMQAEMEQVVQEAHGREEALQVGGWWRERHHSVQRWAWQPGPLLGGLPAGIAASALRCGLLVLS